MSKRPPIDEDFINFWDDPDTGACIACVAVRVAIIILSLVILGLAILGGGALVSKIIANVAHEVVTAGEPGW